MFNVLYSNNNMYVKIHKKNSLINEVLFKYRLPDSGFTSKYKFKKMKKVWNKSLTYVLTMISNMDSFLKDSKLLHNILLFYEEKQIT